MLAISGRECWPVLPAYYCPNQLCFDLPAYHWHSRGEAILSQS